MAIVRLRSADLKQALESGALSLHYQPQVVIATGKLAGVEAFVRWPHPAYGMIGPSDIITLVDQAGMHVEFDRWVVGAICRQAKQWRRDGVAAPIVAANVWVLPYQGLEYLIARDATRGEDFDDRQGTQVGAALTVIRLVAIALAVPVWQAMGLVGG